MKNFAKAVIKHRTEIIFLSISLTLLFAYFIKDLKVNPDMISYLPDGDQAVKLAKYIGENYGGNLMAMVAIETEEIFTKENLEKINLLTQSFRQLDGVAYVISLTNIIDIRKSQDEGIEVGKLIYEGWIPETREELDKLKKYALSKELYKGRIISEDGKVALIICKLQPDADKIKVAKNLKSIVEQANIPGKLYFGGLPFQMIDMSELIIGDLKFLTPVVVLVISLVLFLSFRNLRGVILPLIPVAISIIFTFGLMALFKVKITMISDSIPVILTAVGSAYGIHIVNKFREDFEITDGKLRSEIALSEVMLPVSLAGITTIAGFLSFIPGSYLTAIKEYGIFSALGVLFCLLASIILLPSILSFVKGDIKTNRKFSERRGAKKIVKFLSEKKVFVLLIGALLAIFGAIGVPMISREVSILDYFKPGTQIRKTEEMMKAKFGGSLPLYVLVKGDILDPKTLSEMDQIQEFLKSLRGVKNPQSIVDLLKDMNDVMGEGRRIPDTKEKVQNLMFLIEGEELTKQLINSEKNEALIQATVSYESAKKISEIVNAIDKYIEDLKKKNPDIQIQHTGTPLIYKHLDESIIKSQIQSLIIAIILIFVIISIQLGSISGGAVGIIPVALTILIVYGFMGYARIPLDIATVLVASVSLGIGIDYSIHFINRFKFELKNGNVDEALVRTYSTTGVAIMINVLTVALGFLVFAFSSIIPLQRFGFLVLLTTFLSGFGALVIIPAIILSLKPKFIIKHTKRTMEEKVDAFQK